MRRSVIALPVLLVTLAVPVTPSAAATNQASGCTAGPKRKISWAVTGDRTIRRHLLKDGQITTVTDRYRKKDFPVADITLSVRACKSRITKEWRTLDVYALPNVAAQQRDLATTISPDGDGYAVSIKPRDTKAGWGLGAYPGARAENSIPVQNAVCTEKPRPLSDYGLMAVHGLLSLPIPLPLAGPPGIAAEVGVFAANAAIPSAGEQEYQCGDGGSATLEWQFARSGRVKHKGKRKQFFSIDMPATKCSGNVPPQYDTCSQQTSTLWTYRRD